MGMCFHYCFVFLKFFLKEKKPIENSPLVGAHEKHLTRALATGTYRMTLY
jgi:hypothetical protein